MAPLDSKFSLHRAIRSAAIVAFALSALTVHDVVAQSVKIVIREQTTDAPVRGAIVSLIDSSGKTIVEGLTTAAGDRLLPAPAGGYRIRVRRIGYAPFLSENVSVTNSGTVETRLFVPAHPVSLSGMTVTDRRKFCARAGDGDISAGLLWEVIRGSLATSELAIRDSLVRLRVETFERTLDASKRAINVQHAPPRNVTGQGFARANPEGLSRLGYIAEQNGELLFLGPDAGVLLSASFEADHCFASTTGRGARAGLVGLTFEPTSDRSVPDIAGVLWVDTASAQLSQVEFHYVRSPAKIASDDVGGTIEFHRGTFGGLFISGWLIRMPRIEMSVGMAGPQYALTGFIEKGGLAAEMVDGSQVASVRAGLRQLVSTPVVAGRIEGIVFDSLLNRGLARARISVDGGAEPVSTDSAGRFAIDSAPPGRKTIRAKSETLDSLGLSELSTVVEISPGSTAHVELAVPSLKSLMAGRCADSMNIVTGIVRDAASDAIVPNASVTFAWLAVERGSAGTVRASVQEGSGTADADGRYTNCIASNAEASVRALAGTRQSGTVPILFGARRVTTVDLYVGNTPATSVDGKPRTIGAAARGTAALVGHVRNARGAPIAGAIVTVADASVSERTDSAGRFDLRLLPAGSHAVDAIHVGYAPLRIGTVLRPNRATEQDIILEAMASLPTVAVRAAARDLLTIRSEVAARKRQGFGVILTEQDIAQIPTNRVESLLENINSLIVSFEAGDAKLDSEGKHGPGHLVLKFPTILATREQYCDANVYIDGRYTAYIDDVRSLLPSQIVAIEVYKRPSEAPAKYALLRNGCGVILIWTKAKG